MMDIEGKNKEDIISIVEDVVRDLNQFFEKKNENN